MYFLEQIEVYRKIEQKVQRILIYHLTSSSSTHFPIKILHCDVVHLLPLMSQYQCIIIKVHRLH